MGTLPPVPRLIRLCRGLTVVFGGLQLSSAGTAFISGISDTRGETKGAITSKIKHVIKLKTSPARLAQLLQPSLAFCFSAPSLAVS